MAKSKIDFRSILIEAVLIVFTVLLALALSEWRNSIKENRTKQAVLNNIVQEIESNKLELEEKLGYHSEIAKKLGSYLNSDSLWSTLTYRSGMEAMIQIMDKGLQNPNLQTGAWRTAEVSGVVGSFDYETIYTLSNVYRIQMDGPENTWKQLAKLFTDPTLTRPENAKQLGLMLQLGFNELASQERSLLRHYERSLEELGKDN